MYYIDVKKGGFYMSKTYSFELKKKVVQLYVIIDLFNREAVAYATGRHQSKYRFSVSSSSVIKRKRICERSHFT